MKRILVNERGFSTAIIAAVIVAVLAVGGGVYYFATKDGSEVNTSSSNAQSVAANESCMSYINDSDFCKFTSSWNMRESITTTIDTSEGSKMVIRSNGSNSHSTITTANGPSSEVILLNGASYMKNTEDGTWTKFGDAGDATPTDDYTPDINFEDEASKDTFSVTKIGEEACGELTCLKYQITDTATPDTETFVWFDTNEFKARRMTTKNTEGVSELTFTYEEVVINEPSPIVEAPSYEGMSAEELQQQMQSIGQ